MAKKSIAHLEAELEAQRAKCQGLEEQLAAAIAENKRVQRVLTNTQQWLAKYKKQAYGETKRRVSDDRVDGLTRAQRAIREHRERAAS